MSERESIPRLVLWIWLGLVVHLALGMIAYAHFLLTGQYTLIHAYFSILGSLFFLVMTAAECSLAFICFSWFYAGEPMRLAWGMMACAALARFLGTLLRAVASGNSVWSTWHSTVPGGTLQHLDTLGMVIGEPLAMACLAVGLWRVLTIQRRFRMLGSLTRGDQLLLALIGAFTLSQVALILPLLGTHPSWATRILWLSDPLLSLLLVEAVLVRRSVLRMGQGLVAQCWGMFVAAIVITSIGDATIYASSHNLLPDALTALSWYIWFVGAAAFASAPAYQLAAMSMLQQAGAGHQSGLN